MFSDSYCGTLKSYQVENVLIDEARRKPFDAELYMDAYNTLVSRGISPEEVLHDHGVKIPKVRYS